MASVTDYGSLSQAVQDWFARSDLAGWIDYFIQMAEADIYRDIFAGNKQRGTRDMEASLNTTANGASTALPTGYLGMKIMLVSTASQTYEVERVTPEFIFTQYPSQSASGVPAYFARLGQNFVFGPYPDSAYALTGIYWQKSAQLSSTNTTTWMTSAIPTVLLACVNKYAAQFCKDESQAQMWAAMYTQGLQSYIAADQAEEFSGSALAMVAA